jgi:cell division protein FtsA
VPADAGDLPRKASRRVLSDIIEPRVEEIFAVIRKRIEDTGMLEQLSAGAVLTGGGVLMEGMTEFAEEILGMPVRLGVPVGVRGITQLVAGPQYATGVGLVQYGANALAQARALAPVKLEVGHAGRVESRREKLRERESRREVIEEMSIEKRSSGRFWNWLRAAF